MRNLFGNFKDNSIRVNINLSKQNLHSVPALGNVNSYSIECMGKSGFALILSSKNIN